MPRTGVWGRAAAAAADVNDGICGTVVCSTGALFYFPAEQYLKKGVRIREYITAAQAARTRGFFYVKPRNPSFPG